MTLKKKLEDQIDRNDYFVVKHGILLVLGVFALTLYSLVALKIGEKSLFQMVIEYYFR